MSNKILFVDDEEFLSTLMQMSLRQAGVEAVLAGSYDEALEVLKRDHHAHNIKALFTDIHIPGNSGWELIEVVRGLRPDMKFMVISADMDSVDRGKAQVLIGNLLAYFDKGRTDHDMVVRMCKEAVLDDQDN